MTTAARFSAGAGSLAGSRKNAAQSSAIFRRVVSSKDLTMQLDYNTSAFDEMTGTDFTGRDRPDMTDKAAEKLISDGWTMVETTGFINLVGPLWQRMMDGEPEYAVVAQDKHHNRRGLVQGGLLMTFADRACGMTARFVSGKPTMATVQLDVHFVDAGKIGEILMARPRVIRTTRSLVFVSTEVRANNRTIIMANGVFKILKDGS
jgi:acyl-coenzyme A thioesterase PaaI-like protein